MVSAQKSGIRALEAEKSNATGMGRAYHLGTVMTGIRCCAALRCTLAGGVLYVPVRILLGITFSLSSCYRSRYGLRIRLPSLP